MAGTRSPVPIVYLDESIGFLVPSFLRPDGSGPSSLRSSLSSLRPGLSSPTYRFITIVIKGADKGGAIVIQNRNDYINEGNHQLGDTNFYKEMDSDLTEYHNIEVTNLIGQLRSNHYLFRKEITHSRSKKLLRYISFRKYTKKPDPHQVGQ